MKILSIDFGLRRVGIAVGSTESRISFPREPMINDQALFSRLESLTHQEAIDRILVGMPLKRDGSPGDIQPELQSFLVQLKLFGKPVDLFDERYTSKIAEGKLRQIGMKAKEQREVLDSTAAQVLLQEWLDQMD